MLIKLNSVLILELGKIWNCPASVPVQLFF